MSEPESLTPYGRERIRREHLEAAIRELIDAAESMPSYSDKNPLVLVPTSALSKLQDAMRD